MPIVEVMIANAFEDFESELKLKAVVMLKNNAV